MTLKSIDLADGAPVKARKTPLGLVSGRAIERAFIAFLYLMVLLLAALSVFGTFYGMPGQDAPLGTPWRMALDAAAAPAAFGVALALQGALTITQWGAQQMARRHNPRWWFLYLAALGLSVYYNLQAYYEPAVALGAAPLIAVVLIIGGDVATEFAVIRRD